MKVKALNSFVGTVNGIKYRVAAGDVLDLPDGADWLRAGLVEVEPEPEAEPTPEAPKPARKKAKV